MFSKACEYGIRAVIYIAEQSLLDKRVSLKQVAKSIDSPEAYTSKILQKLKRNNIIHSDKGPTGGFSIKKRDINRIKLSMIVFAIDGDSIYRGCALGLKLCNETNPCPVHNEFKSIRDQLRLMLETTSIKSLAIDYGEGHSFLKR